MNGNELDRPLNRRRWLEGLLRNGLLAGIALLSALLGLRRLRGGCRAVTANCQHCRLSARCELPAAISLRSEQASKESM